LASAAPRSPYRHLELCGIVIRNKAGIVKTYTVHLLLLYLIQAL
jgi:hypothetical protein